MPGGAALPLLALCWLFACPLLVLYLPGAACQSVRRLPESTPPYESFSPRNDAAKAIVDPVQQRWSKRRFRIAV